MKWLQIISQLLIQYSVQQQNIKAAPEKIKGIAGQAGIYFVGLCFFAVLSLSSIVMIFVDLGHQWDAGNGTHFSGTMGAALWMFGLGVTVFAACICLAQYISNRPVISPKAVPTETSGPSSDINPLIVFGEEFLAQLIKNLSQK